MYVIPDSGVRYGQWQLGRKISDSVNINVKSQRSRKLTVDDRVNGEKEVDKTSEKEEKRLRRKEGIVTIARRNPYFSTLSNM